MTTVYAITRKRDPSTGDVLMDAAPHANQWAHSSAPMTEVVAMTLRTQLGACMVDEGLGVDWRKISKLTTGAAALARFEIERGLARYVRAGRIASLLVEATVTGNRCEYAVTFTDPRLQTRPRITGSRAL